MHAVCQNLNTEDEVENVADIGFDCSMCRPYMPASNGKRIISCESVLSYHHSYLAFRKPMSGFNFSDCEPIILDKYFMKIKFCIEIKIIHQWSSHQWFLLKQLT
jgi:hypothetical protein